MATRFNKGGASAPPAIIAAAILSLPRAALSAFIERAIERLDEIDGDPDNDTGNAEDEIYAGDPYFLPRGPGCVISDDDHGRDGES